MKSIIAGFVLAVVPFLTIGCGSISRTKSVNAHAMQIHEQTSTIADGKLPRRSCGSTEIVPVVHEVNGAPLDFANVESTEPLDLPPLMVGWTEFHPDSAAEPEDEGPCTAADGTERLSFCQDFRTAPTWLSQDLRSLASWENAAFLTAAAGGAAMLRTHVDGQVQQDVAQHHGSWGGASHALNRAGEAVVHVPLLAGLYSYSLYSQDAELHELTLALVASYKFTAVSTLALQYATDSRHGHHGGLNMLTDSGFPSMPASTSFALAAVADEKFGWKVGIPCYAGAGLIGWAGIEQQQHRVSDVVFGAALGYAIGKSIGALHYRPDATFKLIPFFDAQSGTQGMQLERQF